MTKSVAMGPFFVHMNVCMYHINGLNKIAFVLLFFADECMSYQNPDKFFLQCDSVCTAAFILNMISTLLRLKISPSSSVLVAQPRVSRTAT